MISRVALGVMICGVLARPAAPCCAELFSVEVPGMEGTYYGLAGESRETAFDFGQEFLVINEAWLHVVGSADVFTGPFNTLEFFGSLDDVDGPALEQAGVEFDVNVPLTPTDSVLDGNGTVRYEGSAEVDGVECDVLYVEYDRVGVHARWYFGKDGLPRKVERLSNMLDYLPKEQQFVEVLTLSDVKLNPAFVVTDFQLKLPTDYEDIELAPRPELLTAGTTAPDWRLKTPDGNTVSLASLRGNVVVMDFWATWCGPCKIAMPEVQKVHEHFHDQSVKVFGVNCMEGAGGDPAHYMRSQKFTYSLLLDGDGVADAYNVSGIPTFYVVDQQGRIAFSSVGAGSEEGMTAIIEKLLMVDPTTDEDIDS